MKLSVCATHQTLALLAGVQRVTQVAFRAGAHSARRAKLVGAGVTLGVLAARVRCAQVSCVGERQRAGRWVENTSDGDRY